MDESKQREYEKALQSYGAKPDWPSFRYLSAICLTKLGRFASAEDAYRFALRGFLDRPRDWRVPGLPNNLVDCYLMANAADVRPDVVREVEAYKSDRRGRALVPLYSYAVLSVAGGSDQEALQHAEGLLAKPRVKWTWAAGQAISALVDQDHAGLRESLDELLAAHRGMAKHGALRETPEGFLCMPAMSILLLARRRGLLISVTSEYVSMEYVEHLLG